MMLGKNSDDLNDDELNLVYRAELEICPSCHTVMEFEDLVPYDKNKEVLLCKKCNSTPVIKPVEEDIDED